MTFRRPLFRYSLALIQAIYFNLCEARVSHREAATGVVKLGPS